MKFRKQRYIESLANAPVLRTIRTAYSVRYHVFNPKVNEQLCSVSRQGSYNLITINYGRLKHWLKKGLSFHPSNLLETENILWHKGLTPLAKQVYSNMAPQQKCLPGIPNKIRQQKKTNSIKPVVVPKIRKPKYGNFKPAERRFNP